MRQVSLEEQAVPGLERVLMIFNGIRKVTFQAKNELKSGMDDGGWPAVGFRL
jgi:hypothetical protein